MKKLPIGLQDFPALIRDGYLYVDKQMNLVGVAFDTEAKNIREWKAEEG